MLCIFRTIAACVLLLMLIPVMPLGGAEPREDRCVVLISVDGLAGFYLDDPRAEMPTLRGLAQAGASSDSLVCSFPTVTWPNHTTLVTGAHPEKHGVLGNNYLDRSSGEKIALIPDPLFDKDEIVRTPTIYDVAHRAGLTTAGIVWPATRSARTLDFTVPDMFGAEAWPKYGTARWLEELREAGIAVDRHGVWTGEPAGGVQRDWLYTRMAAHLFRHHRPNLLLIHLVEVDHVQHKFGPHSPEAYWSVSYADDRIRDLVEAARQSPLGEKTTFVIASDHGFFPIEKDIRPNVHLQKAGLVTAEGNAVKEKQAWCVSQGGACMVYILDDAHREELTARLQKELGGLEGVDAVITPDRFGELGLATREEDPRAPDFWLSARSGYSFTDAHAGEEVVVSRATRGGTHGYLPDQPELWGSLVISGEGIQPGVSLGKVPSIDVAPTIARLLGVDLPTADGSALTKALLQP